MTGKFSLCCLVLGVALSANAATLYVDINSTNPVPPYSSWETAAVEIQDAVDVAAPFDTVLVNDGLYYPGSIDIRRGNKTLRSAGAAESTIFSGLIDIVSDREAVIDGFTFFDAVVSIDMNSGSAIRNCSFFVADAEIRMWGGNELENCSFELSNVSIDMTYNSLLTRCFIKECDNVELFAERVCDLRDCVVTSNNFVAVDFQNSVKLEQCVLHGGDGRIDMRDISAENSVFSFYEADVDVYISSFDNCTLFVKDSGGVLHRNTFDNSIVAVENSTIISSSDTYYSSCSPFAAHGVDGNISLDPMLVDIGSGVLAPLPSSPCLNAGSNALVYSTVDLKGDPRIVDFCVDMGACEYQGTVDSDEDGMSDGYENYYFNNKTNAVATNDTDQDGQSDGEEYVTGMSPIDPLSLFSVTHFSVATNTGNFTLEWVAKPDRLYSILWTPTLTNTFQMLATDIEYPSNQYTDTVYSAESAGFYRVEVSLEP